MYKTNLYIALCIYLLAQCTLQGQNSEQKVPIFEVLEQITEKHAITFNYESSLLEQITVSPISQDLSLSDKIKTLEEQTNLIFKKVSNLVYTISKTIRLCGYIEDSKLQQPLQGATINSKFAYAVADENGYFEVELKSLNELITIRHIGFKTIERQVGFFNLEDCATINLLEHQEVIASVLIETYLVRGIDKRQDWTTSIDYERFSLLPGLIESDVLQTVQALPSILSVDETVSNINIRGGSHDQNLMLWDDIKMYQTGHFFGLISSFNPLMTQTANCYK